MLGFLHWPTRAKVAALLEERARALASKSAALESEVDGHRRAEESLRQSQGQLQLIVDNMNAGVMISGMDGRLVHLNRAAIEMHGFERESEWRRQLAEFTEVFELATLDGRVLPFGEWPMSRLLRDERFRDCELRVRRLDKPWSRVYSYGGELVLDGSGRQVAFLTVFDVTERKRVERRLAAQHAVTRILADSPSLEIASEQILEALCKCLDWTRGELWRPDPDQEVLQCLLSWQHLADRKPAFDEVSKRLRFKRGESLPGEIWARRQPVWLPDVTQAPNFRRRDRAMQAGLHAAVGFPVMRGDQVLAVLTFFSQDISEPDEELIEMMQAVGSQIGQFIERRRTEADLLASEERFRQITENIREVFWLSDPATLEVLYASPAYETMWGRSREDLYRSADDWLDGIHPADRARVQEAWRTEASGNYDIEYRVVRPDGSMRWIHDRGFPVRNSLGQVYRIAGVAEDITERKAAEAATRGQQDRLVGIVDSAMDGIITIDPDMRMILVNQAAERMFGYTAGELMGEPVEMLMPERFRATHSEHVRQFSRTGVAARAMGRFGPISGLRSSGEEFPIEASISQVEIDGRKMFTVTCRDVSERVRAAENTRSLEAQLQQSQKMDAFGQLAGGVAHDFNNLLTIISGYSDILLSTLPAGSDSASMLREIQGAGRRAAGLTRQLLAFSRQQVLEPKVVDLNAVVREIEKMLRRLIGEDLELAAVLRPGIRRVKVDPGQIEQVIMNIVVNARDSMPQGGRITIETDEVELDEQYARTHADARSGRFVRLAISDSGTGMTPEIKARIFEPFFTTKGVGKGTGLGLAVVHGIVRQSGGSIEVYSEIGVGTTFKIYLPAVDAPMTESQDMRMNPTPRGSETILLVEDEEAVREFASMVLKGLGYSVVTASSGQAALELMQNQKAQVDLLVTDVVMPEMSGRRLAEALRVSRPRLKVLFTSGYTDDAVVRHGVLLAEAPFVQKPFTPHALARKVREVLDHE